MRILFISPFYKPYLGGIERVIEQLGQHFLDDNRVEKVGVLTTKWSFPRNYHSDWADHETIDGIEVFRVNSWPQKALPFYQVPLVWFFINDIRKAIEKFKPDIIQWMTDKWFWGNYWSWFFSRKQAKVFFSPSFHDLSILRIWLRPINAFLARKVNKVQVITELERTKVQKAYFAPENKFAVIPWAADKEEIGIIPILGMIPKIGVTILAVGRLSKHKGQAWLIDVFADLINICDSDLKLILVGEDEGEGVILREMVDKKCISDKVLITGKVSEEELARYYQNADIFALFPEYEAFGLVFLEAMMHALPVVTHRVGAIEGVLQDKAFITDPYNRAQAKVILAKLIDDQEFRESAGQRGREFVSANFSWEKTAQSFLALYQQH
ncbi:glycosyltransferase family 4 protein [Patescibacteria group bacterium]|nr:glycosyltransferase family 4 protein [Patescibacteria group bacterium]MBU1868182.1 glycosyltransferase family 4 protein [Patescibacteria group bacterium]